MTQNCTMIDRSNGNHPFDSSNRVSIKSLSFEEQLTLMWGWWWRQLVVGILAVIITMIPFMMFGFVVGVIYAARGQSASHAMESARLFIQLLALLFGSAVGFFCLLPTIKWLTRVRFGDIELHLVRIGIPKAPVTGKSGEAEEFVCDQCGASVKWGQEYCLGCSEKLVYEPATPAGSRRPDRIRTTLHAILPTRRVPRTFS